MRHRLATSYRCFEDIVSFALALGMLIPLDADVESATSSHG